MSSLQARIQVLFQEPCKLAEQMTRLNRITAANCPGNCFITLFTAILNPATGRIEYCNAGHNPPLLIHKNDEVERLGASGLVLGNQPSKRPFIEGNLSTPECMLTYHSFNLRDAR